MRSLLLRLIPMTALMAGPAVGFAQVVVQYHDIHPIPAAYGGGLCEDEGVHEHDYVPVDVEYYQISDEVYYWVGDPGDEDFEYELYWYDHHHPVPVVWGGGYCYIVGAHRHWWEPHIHFSHHYVLVSGRYAYRGPWGKRYRPRRALRPHHYHRASHKGPHAHHHKHKHPHARAKHAAKSRPGASKPGRVRPVRVRRSPRRSTAKRPYYNTRIERRPTRTWRKRTVTRPRPGWRSNRRSPVRSRPVQHRNRPRRSRR